MRTLQKRSVSGFATQSGCISPSSALRSHPGSRRPNTTHFWRNTRASRCPIPWSAAATVPCLRPWVASAMRRAAPIRRRFAWRVPSRMSPPLRRTRATSMSCLRPWSASIMPAARTAAAAWCAMHTMLFRWINPRWHGGAARTVCLCHAMEAGHGSMAGTRTMRRWPQSSRRWNCQMRS